MRLPPWQTKNVLLKTFFDDESLHPGRRAAHNPSFVIKVTEGTLSGPATVMIVKPHLKMTNIPPPSGPSVFSTGTLTFSNVTYAVPAVGD